MSCPTTRALSIFKERTKSWICFAASNMSILCGIDESPMPGKSGAITVNFSASVGMIGRHIREVSANPCKRITISGPLPAVR